MVASSSSNLLLVPSTHHHLGHVRNNSIVPNDYDLTTATLSSSATANRGYMICSNSSNSISGNIGSLKDIMIILENFVAPMVASSKQEWWFLINGGQ